VNFNKIYDFNKPVSCGMLIYDPEEKCILAGHPTNRSTKKGNFDILKGHMDAGETPKETALRELKEESGIVLSPSEIHSLKDLGEFNYSKKKNLHLFMLEKPIPPLYTLKCESIVDGETFPEMDDYKKIPITELDWFFPNLQKVLKKVF
jgi:8-oxo-dGTP pyrophosphatase MutT (NUDIX family)